MPDGPRARPPKEVVREGWDRASEIYRADDGRSDVFGHSEKDHRAWLQPLREELPPGAAVLDLGCGCGVPDASQLSERFRVVGVDLSERQIARARRLVPTARFQRADMTTLEFPGASFGAVVCLYALIHVPLPEQEPLLARIRRWIVPGGWLILVTGHEAFEGTEEDWLGSGAPMYWSHADASTYRRWLEELGFELVRQTELPEGESSHELFQARVPQRSWDRGTQPARASTRSC